MPKSRWPIIFLLWIASLMAAEAHDSKVAYFDIQIVNENVVVQAEFPWTIRNALLTYQPHIQDSLDQNIWQKAFRKYVEASLVLIDKKGNQLKLLTVEQLDIQGHSHQVNYTFTYSGSDFDEITNTFMFNLSDKQTNYHTIKNGDKSISLNTKKGKPTVRLNTATGNYYFIIIIPFLIVTYLLVKARRQYSL